MAQAGPCAATRAQPQPVPSALSGNLPATGAKINAGQPATAEPEPPRRSSSARYLWALLIARVYEVFPLVCRQCGGQMSLIAFTTDGPEVRKILTHIGAEPQAPRITPARDPPLWDACDTPQAGGSVEGEPDWDFVPQVAPEDPFDQRVSVSW